MNENEINYFLDGVTIKQELIESIEGLREEMRKAMAPMMEPVYKKPQKSTHEHTLSEISVEYAFANHNQYELAVVVYMHVFNTPQTMQEIANMTKTSIGSVKRAIKSLMKKGDVMRAPFQSGYILTKFNK